jgi:hypothetical protein
VVVTAARRRADYIATEFHSNLGTTGSFALRQGSYKVRSRRWPWVAWIAWTALGGLDGVAACGRASMTVCVPAGVLPPAVVGGDLMQRSGWVVTPSTVPRYGPRLDPGPADSPDPPPPRRPRASSSAPPPFAADHVWAHVSVVQRQCGVHLAAVRRGQ